jgi:hypothetical protein
MQSYISSGDPTQLNKAYLDLFGKSSALNSALPDLSKLLIPGGEDLTSKKDNTDATTDNTTATKDNTDAIDDTRDALSGIALSGNAVESQFSRTADSLGAVRTAMNDLGSRAGEAGSALRDMAAQTVRPTLANQSGSSRTSDIQTVSPSQLPDWPGLPGSDLPFWLQVMLAGQGLLSTTPENTRPTLILNINGGNFVGRDLDTIIADSITRQVANGALSSLNLASNSRTGSLSTGNTRP